MTRCASSLCLHAPTLPPAAQGDAAHPCQPPYRRCQRGETSSSSLTSLLTSDDTREAHSFLESDQLLISFRCSGGRADSISDILGTVRCVARAPDKLACCRDEEAPRGNSVPFEPATSLFSTDGRELKKHAFPNGQVCAILARQQSLSIEIARQALAVPPKLLRFADMRMRC